MLAEVPPAGSPPGVLRLPAPMDLDDPAVLVALVGTLREAMERSERVEWSTPADPSPGLVRLVEHLPPPRGSGPTLDAWRERHLYGALYVRHGPGFLSIRERRTQWPASVTTLAGDSALSCWAKLRRPTRHRCGICEELEADGLVLRVRGLATRLPYRLRFPPTPFLAI